MSSSHHAYIIVYNFYVRDLLAILAFGQELHKPRSLNFFRLPPVTDYMIKNVSFSAVGSRNLVGVDARHYSSLALRWDATNAMATANEQRQAAKIKAYRRSKLPSTPALTAPNAPTPSMTAKVKPKVVASRLPE